MRIMVRRSNVCSSDLHPLEQALYRTPVSVATAGADHGFSGILQGEPSAAAKRYSPETTVASTRPHSCKEQELNWAEPRGTATITLGRASSREEVCKYG